MKQADVERLRAKVLVLMDRYFRAQQWYEFDKMKGVLRDLASLRTEEDEIHNRR